MTQYWQIVCDGNSQYGIGHIKRAQVLADYLQQQQIMVEVTVVSNLTSSKWLEENAELVIFDLPYQATEFAATAQKNHCFTVSLDCCSEIPLDLSLFIYLHPWHQVKNSYLTGYQFVMIRDEFKALSQKPITSNHHVFIALGGADVKHQSLLVCEQLLALGAHVTLVLGQLSLEQLSDKQKHQLLAFTQSTAFNYHVAPSNFAHLMNQSDWCVTNGGGCLFESLYLHKPTWVLAQTAAEQNIADDLSQQQFILGQDLNQLKQLPSLTQLKQSVSRIQSLQLGNGAAEILNAIQQLREQ